jgi:predicted TIM-barrel fold metal-dependent hydrolase
MDTRVKPAHDGVKNMKTITLEEHFATPGFFDGPGRELKHRAETVGGRYANLIERLCDIGTKRLAEMDAAGIDMQVVSLTSPGVEQLEAAEAIALAYDTNDYLADAVKKNPARFAGLAAVATPAPDKAATELEARVRAGFKGAVINGHSRGRYLDDKFYSPILECAQALNVPIYLHPTPPPKAVLDTYYGGFAPMLTEMLAGGAWGWHIETAVHVIRLISGGVFDRFPQLQIVIGHMGEGLPFMFQRFDIMPLAVTKLKRSYKEYLRENVHYTFSGFNFPPAFLDLFLELGGVDRIMFSADHPYQSMPQARAFLEQIPVPAADKERIAHGNAERLFRL